MKTFFVPVDEKEHRRGNQGYDVPDYCRNCGFPFDEHHNGVCPETEASEDTLP